MSQDQKQEAIIEAAVKRFAHFGVGKTTMTEIANDLSISKALLYYYFPDKLSLYAAVLKSISQVNAAKDEEQLRAESDPWKAIQLYLEIRTAFIIKYHNLLEHLQNYPVNNIPPELADLFSFFKQRELQRITAIIEKGKQSKSFKIKDTKKAAELYYDFLEGFRHAAFNRIPNIFPDKKQFQSILKREKEYSVIFFNGLTQNNDL